MQLSHLSHYTVCHSWSSSSSSSKYMISIINGQQLIWTETLFSLVGIPHWIMQYYAQLCWNFHSCHDVQTSAGTDWGNFFPIPEEIGGDPWIHQFFTSLDVAQKLKWNSWCSDNPNTPLKIAVISAFTWSSVHSGKFYFSNKASLS